MTTIEHGGGPTLNQRKNFIALDERAKIPGYKGYCPSLKFTFGKTFSTSTKEINNENFKSNKNDDFLGSSKFNFPRVPQNNGLNKYTTNMVSGYTGFIPKSSTKFGKTYREECERCFEEHLLDLQQYKDRVNKDKLTFQQSTKFREPHISSKEDFLKSLNEFSDRHSMHGGRKPATEAPMTGYTGFVPKKNTTELGLGASYNKASEKSLEKFDLETTAYKNKMAALESNVTCCCRYLK